MQLIHRYKRKRESLQEFNFDVSELIQTIMNCKPKDMMHPLKIYMYLEKLFNPLISSKTIQHAHLTLQKAIYYVQKVEREFLLVKGIQQTEFDS